MDKPKYPTQTKYHREKCTQVILRLSHMSDADILSYLDTLPNKRGYIKALIRADMARASKTDKD